MHLGFEEEKRRVAHNVASVYALINMKTEIEELKETNDRMLMAQKINAVFTKYKEAYEEVMSYTDEQLETFK